MNWDEVPIRRVFRIVNGGTPRSDEENWGGDVQWATPVDLAKFDGGRISQTDRTLTPTGLAAGSRAVRAGSLIVSSRAPIGYVAENTVAMAFNQGCKGLEPSADLDTRFFRYQLSVMTERLQSRGQGSTFVELSGDDLAAAPIMVPPRAEQRAIADYLDTETARIDALITKKHRIVELLLARHRSLIDDVMRVELEADASQVSRLRLRYVLRERDVRGMMNEEVLSVYRDHGVVPKASRDDNFNKTPPDVSNYKLVCPGDVVVNKMKAWQGSVAVSSHRGIVSGDYLVCEPVADVETSYLHYQLRSPRAISEYVVRSSGIRPSQWRLYWDDFGDIAIPIPSPQVQQQVVQRLDHQSGLVSDAARRQERMIGLLEEHRQALITAAVTGELEVPGVAA